MSDLATIDTSVLDGRLVCRLSGEVDISNALEVGATIERAVPKDAVGVIVDLSEVRYLDSSGISLLLRLSERLKARRIGFRLVVPDDAPVRSVLELTGLGRMMEIDS